MATNPVHPAVAPAINALNALAAYRPTSATDLADVLKCVHDVAAPCVIEALATTLRQLAEYASTSNIANRAPDSESLADFLNGAADDMYAIGCDDLDRARALTGHYGSSAR